MFGKIVSFATVTLCFAFVNTDGTLKFYQEKKLGNATKAISKNETVVPAIILYAPAIKNIIKEYNQNQTKLFCSHLSNISIILLLFSSPEQDIDFIGPILSLFINYHEAMDLKDNDVKKIAQLSDMNHFKSVLDEILIPRVVGSENHKKVGDSIVKHMTNLGWAISEDKFTESTPVFGQLTFRNIIARLNPDADRYLVLACHYDSKYTREHTFLGATDSAVPCAQMINLAKVMAPMLNNLKNARLSLMFIFFDGEEAFRSWGPTDSIYGAKHLAGVWHETHYKDGASHLQRMDVLVLLDLLGAPDPVFYSYFQSTEKWYVRLAAAEQRLAELNQLQGYSRGKVEQTYFRLRSSGAQIEDDHIPFLRRSVDILHVIPTPFPAVWHTAGDDLSALDFKTIENLNKIFRVFVAEYLHTTP